jgi:hypothetical protein
MAEKKEKEPKEPFLVIKDYKCYVDNYNYIVEGPKGKATYYTTMESMLNGISRRMTQDKIRDKSVTKTIEDWQAIMETQNKAIVDAVAQIQDV